MDRQLSSETYRLLGKKYAKNNRFKTVNMPKIKQKILRLLVLHILVALEEEVLPWNCIH